MRTRASLGQRIQPAGIDRRLYGVTRAMAWTAALSLMVLTACGHSPPSRSDGDPSPIGVSPSAGGELAASRTVRSVLVRHNYVRLPVSSADLSHLVRVRENTLMALTTAGAFEGQTYAARSDDDGGSWVVDGPRFNGGGASGGSQVDHISASSNDTLFAWGGFYANNIWTRPLSAHHWRVASIGSIRRAWSRGGELFVATGYDHRPAVEYVSINNGVSWHQLPNAPP